LNRRSQPWGERQGRKRRPCRWVASGRLIALDRRRPRQEGGSPPI